MNNDIKQKMYDEFRENDYLQEGSQKAYFHGGILSAIKILKPILEKQNKALIEASNALINHYHHNDLDSPLSRIEADIAEVEKMMKEVGLL